MSVAQPQSAGGGPVLVYLHGLNSSSASAKAELLRKGLTPLSVVAPTYPAHRAAEAVTRLSDLLARLCADAQVSLVGSSMGGFYGQYLARRFPVRHLYLINPALQPWDLLPRHVGEHLVPATGERYELTAGDAEATRPFGVERVCDGVATTVFLDRGDQVIDYRIAASLYSDCGRLVVFDGGSHLFEHMAAAIALMRSDYGL